MWDPQLNSEESVVMEVGGVGPGKENPWGGLNPLPTKTGLIWVIVEDAALWTVNHLSDLTDKGLHFPHSQSGWGTKWTHETISHGPLWNHQADVDIQPWKCETVSLMTETLSGGGNNTLLTFNCRSRALWCVPAVTLSIFRHLRWETQDFENRKIQKVGASIFLNIPFPWGLTWPVQWSQKASKVSSALKSHQTIVTRSKEGARREGRVIVCTHHTDRDLQFQVNNVFILFTIWCVHALTLRLNY